MFWNYLKYAIQKDKKIILLVAFILFTANWVFIKLFVSNYIIDVWTNIIDPIVTLITVSTTLLVYFSNSKTDWENNLKKRLTVHFVFKDKYMMSCIQAFLTSEADIRQWGQQIGRQMNKNVNLDFYPFMSLTTKLDESLQYKDFTLTVYLESDASLQQDIKDNYKIWIDNNDKSPENITLLTGNHPTTPYTIEQSIDLHNSIDTNQKIIFQNGQYSIQPIQSNV